MVKPKVELLGHKNHYESVKGRTGQLFWLESHFNVSCEHVEGHVHLSGSLLLLCMSCHAHGVCLFSYLSHCRSLPFLLLPASLQSLAKAWSGEREETERDSAAHLVR